MNRSSSGAIFVFALGILMLAMVGPVAAMLLSMPPAGVLEAFSAAPAQNALRTSFLASLCAVGIASVLGIPAGYELAHRPPHFRALILFMLALPLAFPPVASGIVLLNIVGAASPLGAWLSRYGIAMVDTFAGVVLAEFFVAGSLVVITACAAFKNLDPAYEESAASLGASPWQRFRRIALPLAAPNVLAGVLLAWLRAIGEYGATSIVAYHPTSLPVALYVSLSGSGVSAALALSYGFAVLAALVVALQWAVRRHVV
ncbi:MAG: sulfate ABC transporter permease [Candidatus Meridianibacter frigidus]|nr:MAG: sulfate ABC transporter permease [Candidatus Eremiobacteraeota bacterium]